jgi:hypothetical protein
MKYLRLYEFFDKKPFYWFNGPEFFVKFKEVFYEEKKHKETSELYKILDKIFFKNWKSYPLDALVEAVIKTILSDKEVEFVDIDGEMQMGRVKRIDFMFYAWNPKERDYRFRIKLYEDLVDNHDVDDTKPVKVYGKKTEIEELIDLLHSTQKYNL